jgi:site-specific DNA recombinase
MSAVGYFRVSTLEQASGNNSLPVQESKFSSFWTHNNLKPAATFVDKESARTSERPSFQKMLAYCRERRHKVSHVVVADLSRLARNVLDQGQTIITLSQAGIQLVSVDKPTLDDSAAGKLLKNVLGSMNQFFSDSLSEKTKFRMEAGVKAGRWLWVAPLGYLNEIATKRIVVDSQRAPLVVKAFSLIADGISIGDTLRQVTALGLNTRKGRPVPKQTFSRMLRNPFYCGIIQKNGTQVRGLHDALVNETLFDSVQSKLTGHAPHQIEHEDFPLRGFIRCAKCEKNLTAGWVGGRNKKYSRYWCWTKGCGDVSLRGERLEGNFSTLLGIIQPQAHLLAMIPTLAAHSWADRKERIASDSRALTRRLDDQATLNQRAIKARLLEQLSEEDFRAMKASIASETAKLQEQIAALDSESSSLQDLLAQTEREVIDFGASWREAGTARKREIQNALFPEGLAWDSELFLFCPRNPTLIQFLTDTLKMMHVVGVRDGI